MNQYKVSSIVKRQRFNVEAIQTVLMSISYIGFMMLTIIFVNMLLVYLDEF